MFTVQAKIQSIIDKANSITGKTDTDLTASTQSLVDGFGSGGATNYPVVEMTETTAELQPNTFYRWGEVTSLTLTFAPEINGVASEYFFQFVSGATPTTLDLPDTIKWVSPPTVEANKTYQVSILDGMGVIVCA